MPPRVNPQADADNAAHETLLRAISVSRNEHAARADRYRKARNHYRAALERIESHGAGHAAEIARAALAEGEQPEGEPPGWPDGMYETAPRNDDARSWLTQLARAARNFASADDCALTLRMIDRVRERLPAAGVQSTTDPRVGDGLVGVPGSPSTTEAGVWEEVERIAGKASVGRHLDGDEVAFLMGLQSRLASPSTTETATGEPKSMRELHQAIGTHAVALLLPAEGERRDKLVRLVARTLRGCAGECGWTYASDAEAVLDALRAAASTESEGTDERA